MSINQGEQVLGFVILLDLGTAAKIWLEEGVQYMD